MKKNRDFSVGVWVNSREKRAIEILSRHLGLSRSQLIRNLLLREYRKYLAEYDLDL